MLKAHTYDRTLKRRRQRDAILDGFTLVNCFIFAGIALALILGLIK